DHIRSKGITVSHLQAVVQLSVWRISNDCVNTTVRYVFHSIKTIIIDYLTITNLHTFWMVG
ncbi:MAG TPA: hypothetical protein PLW93_04465, partial [Candidatus Absconditabacterales bacterium]|nr:hypothetical protein [Candidatus Absconditabacterales bacterium]